MFALVGKLLLIGCLAIENFYFYFLIVLHRLLLSKDRMRGNGEKFSEIRNRLLNTGRARKVKKKPALPQSKSMDVKNPSKH